MREQLNVFAAWIRPAGGEGHPPGTQPYDVSVMGSGFIHRAAGLVASFGETPIEAIRIYPEEDGFNGVLRSKPAEGAVLRLGWTDTELIDTDVVFTESGETS